MEKQVKKRKFIPCSIYNISAIESWFEEMSAENGSSIIFIEEKIIEKICSYFLKNSEAEKLRSFL